MKLNKIIALLRDGADADIWYDAKMYQDKPAAKRIAKVKQAMLAAATVLAKRRREAPEPEGGPYASPIEEAMTEYWGARCADVAPGCPCCDAWAAYDAAMAAQARIDAALVHMAQPDYGDTRTALDYYAEGVNLLKGRGLYD